MESVLLYLCSDHEFEKRITNMDIQSLLETVTVLQKEMASEQRRFDDMSSRLAQIPDAESPECESLSAELMAVQANLATLMARNMKCFNQQQSEAQTRDRLSGGSSSLNGSFGHGNGDSLRLLNGHKKHRKTSPRPAHKSRRQPASDEGEPDVAGYEETLTFGSSSASDDHHYNGNGNVLTFESAYQRGGGLRDFHSPETQQQFIDFGLHQVGELTTEDDFVTVEKNKKNETNEARLDERELLEQKAYQDFESLMRFDGDEPISAQSMKQHHSHVLPQSHTHSSHSPGRLFYIDNATQGESSTETESCCFKEIDVDRIGEEDEGEDDDPSEWKYAGDGDNNKLPDGPIVLNNSGEIAQIDIESLVKRHLSQQSGDSDTDNVTSQRHRSDVYDVRRSAATMVLRHGGDVTGDVVTGGSAISSSNGGPEVTVTGTLAERVVVMGPVTGAAPFYGAGPDDQLSDATPIGNALEEDVGRELNSFAGPSTTPPPSVVTIQFKQDLRRGDQNTQQQPGPPNFLSATGSPIPADAPHMPSPSPEPAQEEQSVTAPGEQEQQREESRLLTGGDAPVGEGTGSTGGGGGTVIKLSTSRATLTLSPAVRQLSAEHLLKDPSPGGAAPSTPTGTNGGVQVVQPSRVSLRTLRTTSSSSTLPDLTQPPLPYHNVQGELREKQPQQEEAQAAADPAVSSSTASATTAASPDTSGCVSTAKVHFRSYSYFAPSEVGDDAATQEEEEEDAASELDVGRATDDASETQEAASEMGNTLDGAKARGEKDGDAVSVKSAVIPACLPSEGFTADDKVKNRTTLKDWDPTKLMQDLYKIELVPEEEEDFFEHITMEGYMEKLPINKKKATLLKTWKRRFFKAHEGYLYYYEPPDTVRQKTEDGKDSDRPSGSIQLMGGSIEILENRIIGVDDGRGRYLLVRAPNDADFEDWRQALTSQTVENITAAWVKPVVHAIPSCKRCRYRGGFKKGRNVVIIDIGSCSVRAGILGDRPSLPTLFFPCIMATTKDTGERVFGHEALLPESRANCTLSYPVRPSVKVDKDGFFRPFAVDMAAMPELFDKIFNELNIEPSNYWVMFSAPGNFSDKIKQHFMDILVNRFHVVGVNIVAQTLLSLYSYNSRSGIVVDVGERLEIVPVTDGYIVEAGVTRQPYGGHRITEALNSSFTESKYRFFTDVEFQIVRLAMEKSCYVALEYNAENRKCQQNPRPYKKTIHLEKYGMPSGTWKNVTHTQSRFSSTEGLFNTEMWGMDNPIMHKLVAKAVQVCPMDLRREIWRSIFLSGGVTLLPGFAERLQAELTKLAPPSVKVQVHASPQRYHSAYIGACALANLQEFEQACISSEEWRETGPPCLRKWHMY